MTNLRFLLVGAVALAAASGPARADVIIDSYTTGAQFLINTNAGSTNSSGVAASGAIGGARVISIDNGANVQTSSTLTVSPSLSRLDFTSQVAPPLNATTFGLIYDGSSSAALNPTGLGGINILGQGGTGINLVASNTSNGPELVTVTFYTDATHASSVTLSIPSGAANMPLFASFGSFTPVAGDSAANFGSLGALTAAISYGNSQGSSGEISVISFATVPEPSALALGSVVVVAFLGCARVRRRRRDA